MPIYEYKCPQGHVYELFHSIMEPAPEGCQVCGKGPLVRVLYPVAVHFKGSGFYSTDYGRGGRKASRGDGDKPSESTEKTEKTEKKEPEKKAPAADVS